MGEAEFGDVVRERREERRRGAGATGVEGGQFVAFGGEGSGSDHEKKMYESGGGWAEERVAEKVVAAAFISELRYGTFYLGI